MMEVESGAEMEMESGGRGTKKESVVRMMCSFGGKILPRPHDNQLRYVGGDTRIVAVHRSTTYSTLVSKLSNLLLTNNNNNCGDFTVKYQLPNEDLDALITVSSDEDVENMMEEFERLTVQQNHISNNTTSRVPRLRLFLFPNTTEVDGVDTPRTSSSIASLLDGSRKRENWFLDALNGGAVGPSLERKRSEASSIVSEVPDYLFGLDNSDDTSTKLKNRAGLGDGMPGSDPGSPAFGSSSSASQFPVLPPVKTKPENPNHPVQTIPVHDANPGYGSNPGSPYPAHHTAVQTMPVYYVQAGPGQGLVPQRSSHLQPVSVPVQVQVPVQNPGYIVQQYGQNPVQVPVGYQGPGPMYGAGPYRAVEGMDPYVMQMQGNMVQGQGMRPVFNGAGQPLYYHGAVAPVAGEEVAGPGLDAPKGRVQQP